MDNTIIQQGRFISTGEAEILDLRSDVDWMNTINFTVAGANKTVPEGVEFEWRRGMPQGSGIVKQKSDSANANDLIRTIQTGFGFTLIPKGGSAIITGTTITKAAPPVCTAANHGFSDGDFVLFTNLTNMVQLPLIGFTIGNTTTNTFELIFFDTNTANFVAETAFQVQVFPDFDFKPSVNFISKITKGSTTQVQLTASAPHIDFNVGGLLRFGVPTAYGMPEIDTQLGEILSIDTATNTYTVAIDSSSFSDFAYPASSAFPSSVPIVTDIGSVSNSSVDATSNLSFIGMELGTGVNGPSGIQGDEIFWVAGKSFSVTNQ